MGVVGELPGCVHVQTQTQAYIGKVELSKMKKLESFPSLPTFLVH